MEPKLPPAKTQPRFSDQNSFSVPKILQNLRASLHTKSRPTNPNTKKRLDAACSEVETSIGSSNCNHVSKKLYDTPRRGPLTDIGNRSGGVFAPVYCRKPAPEKTKDKGQQISVPSKDKGKQISVPSKDRGKQISVLLPIYLPEKIRVTGKPAALSTDNGKGVGKVISLPITCTSNVNTRSKKKENVQPFSCPPCPRTMKKRNVSSEAGNMCVSHSFTAPHPKRDKKKRRLSVKKDNSVHALPREFVEQQRAYFKEIDDFELVEELVSENDYDNEVVAKT